MLKRSGGFNGAEDVIRDEYGDLILPAGQGVNVLIIDSGINWEHNDLDGNFKGGYDFINGGEPEDIDGHGTWCSGIIAAEDNEMGIIGVAPEANIYVCRIYDQVDPETLTFDISFLDDAVSWAVNTHYDADPNNDIHVISMSLGIDTRFPKLLPCSLHFKIEIAYNHDIVLVASTGNENKDYIYFPVSHPGVIAVGAVSQAVGGVKRWVEEYSPYGSNYGSGGYTTFPVPWYYTSHIDLVAPGKDIETTHKNGFYYDFFSGTSAAAPHVAGVCALLISQDLQDGVRDLTPGDIKTILCNTADKDIILDYEQYGYEMYGYGFVNVYGVCDLEQPSVSITFPSYYYIGGTITYRASASDNYRVDKVQFKVDPGSWHMDTDPSDGWSWVWNTRSVSNGWHKLYCRAYDVRGNYKETYKNVLVQNGGGGGGCPILSVFDGEEYVEEGLMDIHNPDGIDVIYEHNLFTDPAPITNRYHLRLIEHHKTISHIDKVELWGELPNGVRVRLYLLSAIHSELVQVRRELWISDDRRVQMLGADHNDGISEVIDLEFYALRHVEFSKFIFVIEGNNAIVK